MKHTFTYTELRPRIYEMLGCLTGNLATLIDKGARNITVELPQRGSDFIITITWEGEDLSSLLQVY